MTIESAPDCPTSCCWLHFPEHPSFSLQEAFVFESFLKRDWFGTYTGIRQSKMPHLVFPGKGNGIFCFITHFSLPHISPLFSRWVSSSFSSSYFAAAAVTQKRKRREIWNFQTRLREKEWEAEGGGAKEERGERGSLKQKLHPHSDLPEGKIQSFFLFSGKEEVGSSHYFLASQKKWQRNSC